MECCAAVTDTGVEFYSFGEQLFTRGPPKHKINIQGKRWKVVTLVKWFS